MVNGACENVIIVGMDGIGVVHGSTAVGRRPGARRGASLSLIHAYWTPPLASGPDVFEVNNASVAAGVSPHLFCAPVLEAAGTHKCRRSRACPGHVLSNT